MSFRQLDVDRLDPNSVVNNYPPAIKPNTTRPAVDKVAATVHSLLQSGQVAAALKAALESPPYGCDEETKATATSAVSEILVHARTADIGAIVKDLSSEELDVLVKYVYRAMQRADNQQSCSALLNWLDKVHETAGVAPTTRYINDRRVI